MADSTHPRGVPSAAKRISQGVLGELASVRRLAPVLMLNTWILFEPFRQTQASLGVTLVRKAMPIGVLPPTVIGVGTAGGFCSGVLAGLEKR